eukprot:ctg_6354.g676
MMRELGLTDRMPRLVVAQSANANPLYQAYVNGGHRGDWSHYRAVPAKRTLASAIQIGAP